MFALIHSRNRKEKRTHTRTQTRHREKNPIARLLYAESVFHDRDRLLINVTCVVGLISHCNAIQMEAFNFECRLFALCFNAFRSFMRVIKEFLKFNAFSEYFPLGGHGSYKCGSIFFYRLSL